MSLKYACAHDSKKNLNSMVRVTSSSTLEEASRVAGLKFPSPNVPDRGGGGAVTVTCFRPETLDGAQSAPQFKSCCSAAGQPAWLSSDTTVRSIPSRLLSGRIVQMNSNVCECVWGGGGGDKHLKAARKSPCI